MAVHINISGVKMSGDSKLLNGMKVHDSNVDVSIENVSIEWNAKILDGKVYHGEDVKEHIKDADFNAQMKKDGNVNVTDVKRTLLERIKSSLIEERDKDFLRSR